MKLFTTIVTMTTGAAGGDTTTRQLLFIIFAPDEPTANALANAYMMPTHGRSDRSVKSQLLNGSTEETEMGIKNVWAISPDSTF